jgi:hypothetical protein
MLCVVLKLFFVKARKWYLSGMRNGEQENCNYAELNMYLSVIVA